MDQKKNKNGTVSTTSCTGQENISMDNYPKLKNFSQNNSPIWIKLGFKFTKI